MKILIYEETQHKEYYETYVKMKVDASKYKLTQQDVYLINDEIVKIEDILNFGIGTMSGLYVIAHELSKKPIDKEKFIEGVEKRTKKYLNTWRKEYKDK